LKLAGYAAALARSRERLRRLRREALALQFGGAGGTLAELGERGLVVSERLAALLDLPLPDAPWHGHSDRLAEIASTIAIMTGTWQAQGQAFPSLLFISSGALGAIADIAQGLDVDAERMRRNLEITNGMILADAVTGMLARKIGRNEAQKLVAEDCQKAISEK